MRNSVIGRFVAALLLIGIAAPASATMTQAPSSGGGAPSGAAGGSLSGTYPNPSLNVSGSPCATGSFATSLSSSGALGCAAPTGNVAGFGAGSITMPSGRVYPFAFDAQITGSAFTANTIRCNAGVVARPITVAALLAKVQSNGAGNIQLAIYASKADGTGPSTLLGATQSLSTSSNSVVSGTLSTAIPLAANVVYWRCAAMDNTTAYMISTGNTSAQISGINLNGGGTSIGYHGITFSTQTFGAWPDLSTLTGTEFTTGGVPQIFLQSQ